MASTSSYKLSYLLLVGITLMHSVHIYMPMHVSSIARAQKYVWPSRARETSEYGNWRMGIRNEKLFPRPSITDTLEEILVGRRYVAEH